MAAIGGPVRSVSLDGRSFNATQDAEANRNLGGDMNEVEPNGDGVTARIIKSQTPWVLDGLNVEIDDDKGDQEFLQALANSNRFFTVAVTFASTATWQGSGQLVGEIVFSSKNTTAGISLKGAGTMTKQ